MADSTTNPVLSAIATVNSKLTDLAVKDGQMIFIQDKNTIALDFGGKRKFYKQIEEIATEDARASLLAPVNGQYYFVVSTGVLWTYRDEWVQITMTPKDIKDYADSAASTATITAQAYADELSKRITASVDNDGTVVLMFNDQLFAAE